MVPADGVMIEERQQPKKSDTEFTIRRANETGGMKVPSERLHGRGEDVSLCGLGTASAPRRFCVAADASQTRPVALARPRPLRAVSLFYLKDRDSGWR